MCYSLQLLSLTRTFIDKLTTGFVDSLGHAVKSLPYMVKYAAIGVARYSMVWRCGGGVGMWWGDGGQRKGLIVRNLITQLDQCQISV